MEKIIILDFGSQYTQLIGRRVREQNVYCEIHPYNKCPEIDSSVRGVILSGSPASVRQEGAPAIDLSGIRGKVPVLGVCYGAQYLVHSNGGEVEPSATREYGRAIMTIGAPGSPLFLGVSAQSQVWMSHGDTIVKMPANFRLLASTETVPNAAFKIDGEETYGIQFHPEVFHSAEGPKILHNFVVGICGCSQNWTRFLSSRAPFLRSAARWDKTGSSSASPAVSTPPWLRFFSIGPSERTSLAFS